MSYLASHLGAQPVYLPELGTRIHALRDLVTFFKLLHLIFDFKPDILHTHAAKAGFLGRIVGLVFNGYRRLRGQTPCKFVHTFHGHVFVGYFGTLQSRLIVLAERLLARMTHCIVAIAETQQTELLHKYRVGKPDRYRVVPLGLDLNSRALDRKSGGSLRRELNIPEDSVVLGMAGRLTPVKNHKMFLDAVSQLRNRDVKFKALIVGDGELRSELIEEATVVEDSVLFLGWQRDMARVYGAIDVLCITSVNEGTAVVAIEALASGIPVVSTDVGGVRDLIQDCVSGYLVPLGDVKLYCRRLEELIRDRGKRSRFGKQGQSLVLEKYRIERLCSDLERLYRDLIDRKAPERVGLVWEPLPPESSSLLRLSCLSSPSLSAAPDPRLVG